MANMEWRTIVCVVLFVACVRASRVALEDGSYIGVVVAVSDKTEASRCQQLRKRLEEMFTEASEYLFTATEERAYFREVTFLFPASWRKESCGFPELNGSALDSFQTADIRVDTEHPLYGDTPWTQQSQGCGERGEFIYLSDNFLLKPLNITEKKYGSPGRALVHEWAKYRYGVFDEFGFPNDKLYPASYQDGDMWRYTGCSNVPVQGTPANCDPSSGTSCDHFKPSDLNENVHSSIMYMQFLPNVTQFCNASTHNQDAPTKHNSLCEEKSTLEVIQGNIDFIRDKRSSILDTVMPSFSYVKRSSPQYVFLLETTESMNTNSQWLFLRKAIRKFLVMDLPTATSVGVVGFTNTSQIIKGMTPLSDSTYESIASVIPTSYTLEGTVGRIKPAIETAIEVLEADGNTAGSVIILYTNGAKSSVTTVDAREIIDLATKKKVHIVPVISVIDKPASMQSISQHLDDIARETGGMSYIIRDGAGRALSTHISFYVDLLGAFAGIFAKFPGNSGDVPVVIHEAHYDESINSTIRGTFTIDKTLGRNTLFAIYFLDSNDDGISAMTLVDPDNHKYTGRIEKHKVVNLLTTDAPLKKHGIWTYTVERIPKYHIVRVTSCPILQQIGTVTARVWTNTDSKSVNVSSTPVIIYAEVTSGSLPVLNARVIANVAGITGVGPTSFKLPLLDSGNGAPDVTQGDGVYSRYLTRFDAGDGRYTISLTVDDNEQQTYVLKEESNHRNRIKRALPTETGLPVCCGSEILIPNGKREFTGRFKRLVPGLVQKVTDVPEGDVFPPSRITDLRAVVYTTNKKINFFWTSPGDDYDSGKADKYELFYSKERENLKSNLNLAVQWQKSKLPPPLSAGSPSDFVVTFKHYDKYYYFAMLAVDEEGNKGKMSNIVRIFIPAPPTVPPVTSTSEGPSNTTLFPSESKGEDDKSMAMIGIISGVVGALILLILLSLYCFFFVYRRKEATAKAPYQNGSVKSGVDVIRTPVPEDAEDQDSSLDKDTESLEAAETKDTKDNNQNSPINVISDGKTLSPYQSWTASSLLYLHEQRRNPYETTPIRNSLIEENELYGKSPYNPTYRNSVSNAINTSQNGHVPNNKSIQNGGILRYSGTYDGASLNSANPSDSFLSINSENLARSRTHTNTDYETCIDSDGDILSQRHNGVLRYKVPPPTLPKPVLNGRPVVATYNPSLQGSLTSVNSNQKRRNVTQV